MDTCLQKASARENYRRGSRSRRKKGSIMIQIEHLVKNYGSNCAVDDISLSIGEGEIVGFWAPTARANPPP